MGRRNRLWKSRENCAKCIYICIISMIPLASINRWFWDSTVWLESWPALALQRYPGWRTAELPGLWSAGEQAIWQGESPYLGDLWSPWSLTTSRSSWDDPPRNLWLLCFLSREIYVALESNWIDTVNSQVISLVGYKSLTQPPGKVLGALTTRWTKILDLGEWNYWNHLLSTSPAPEML